MQHVTHVDDQLIFTWYNVQPFVIRGQKLQTSGRVLPALQIPVYLIYLWVPVGFAVTGIQYLLTAYKNLTAKDVYLSTTTLDGYEDSEVEV